LLKQFDRHTTLLFALGLCPGVACGGVAKSSATIETSGPSDQMGVMATPREFPCLDPQPVGGTGYVECSGGGFKHRAFKADCPYLPRKGLEEPTCKDDICYCNVGSDLGCTEKPYGYCSPPLMLSVCHYGCVNDDQCGPNEVCDCGPDHGTCVPADCKLDSDCGSRLCTSVNYCADYHQCEGERFSCQTGSDTCASDRDCGGSGSGNGNSCTPTDAGKVCQWQPSP